MKLRWLMIVLGCCMAVVLVGTFFFWAAGRDVPEAFALIRVRQRPAEILPSSHRDESFDYQRYLATQKALIRSKFVINAALRQPGIARLPIVQQREDAAQWLVDELRVHVENDSEILRVSLRGKDLQSARQLVDAVVDAYFKEAVYAERVHNLRRLDALRQTYSRRLAEIREKSQAINDLAAQTTSSHENVVLNRQLGRLEQRLEQLGQRLLDLDLQLLVMREQQQRKTITTAITNSDAAAREDSSGPMQDLMVKRQLVQKRIATAAKQYNDGLETLKPAGVDSTELSIRRYELDGLTDSASLIKREIEVLEVNQGAHSRIEVIQRASRDDSVGS